MATILLLSYGSIVEARRALFATYSLFCQARHPSSEPAALIFTDQRDFLEPHLRGLPIDYVELTKESIDAIIGPLGYIHRLKIGVIDSAVSRTKDTVLFVDSDTFCTADVRPVVDLISEDACVMHLHEHEFAALRNFPLPGTVQALHRFIDGGSVSMSDGSVVQLNDSLSSWNSGVVGLHPSHAGFIPDVFAICDQLYQATGNRVSEQYAFSIVLQKNLSIRPADPVVYHYWHEVKKQIVDEFLDSHVTPAWLSMSLERRLADVREWTRILPGHIATHPLVLEDRALQCLAEKRRVAALVWALRGFGVESA